MNPFDKLKNDLAVECERREKAEQECSEMREVLESVAELAPDFLDDDTGHFSKLVAHALSSDCGKGYIKADVQPGSSSCI